MNRRSLLILAGGAVVGAVGAGAYLASPGPGGTRTEEGASPLAARAASPADMTAIGAEEVVLGRADAPVTLFMFASLTCGHCAAFHAETFKTLKADYVDTGKLKVVFRDFPLNAPALWASQLISCGGPDRRWGLLDVLFETQHSWAIAPNPQDELAKTARLAGIGDDAFKSCMADQPGMRAKVERMDAWGKAFGIDSTPSFIVVGRKGETRKVVGNQPIDAFRPLIDELSRS